MNTIAISTSRAISLPKINWKLLIFLGFCTMLFFSVLYIFQINQMIEKSYLIRSYEKEMIQLTQENKNLEVNLAQISYIENIQQRAKELNFASVKTIKYIEALDESLAKN